MLIRFAAENFLSFNERTEFNMLTGDVRRHSHHVYKLKNIELLRSAVIYGANGAGKTNLIRGISALKEFVKGGDISSFYNLNKFKLANNIEKSSSLEIEFLLHNKCYTYGLKFTENNIIEEWLLKSGAAKKNDETIFFRKTQKNGKSKVQLHPKFLKEKRNQVLIEVYEQDFLTKTKTFLNLAKNQKFKEISEAYEWIIESLKVIRPGSRVQNLASNLLFDENFNKFTNDSIKEFKTGINELTVVSTDIESYFGQDNYLDKENVLKALEEIPVLNLDINGNIIALREDKDVTVKKVVATHVDSNKQKVMFDILEESDGTLRLLDLIPAVFYILSHPITIFIDEIDQSIHPSILKEFIRKVQDNKEIKGQLIFTTHESNLLDLDLFRQDEIWFAEKNQKGETQFYPLSDYDIRTDLDIRKGYLSGRFGAIPFLGNFKDLNWDKYVKESEPIV